MQVPDEASVKAEAEARLPSEPGKGDSHGCRIGKVFLAAPPGIRVND